MEPTPLERAPSLRFADTARRLAEATRGLGLDAPSFRSPPADAHLDRSVRRRRGDVVVAIRVRGRPFAAVVADMIEGVVVANRLDAAAASTLRDRLWATMTPAIEAQAA